jgi:hypothetical protein
MKNFAEIYQNLNGKTATTIPQAARSSRGKYSLGIVCSEKNGKRITLTASLAKALKLNDVLYITAYADDSIIILSSSAINEHSVETMLKGDDGKISYNAGLVHFLINTFTLNYQNTVSKAFHDFSFNDDPNNPMAILTFPKAQANNETTEVAENENFDED